MHSRSLRRRPRGASHFLLQRDGAAVRSLRPVPPTRRGLGQQFLLPVVGDRPDGAAHDRSSRLPDHAGRTGDAAPAGPRRVRRTPGHLHRRGLRGSGELRVLRQPAAGEPRRPRRVHEGQLRGPGHFKQPLAWVGQMQTSLAGDFSVANLEKHQTLLKDTRDQINGWMQGHPGDYR
ncbi:hypothetical protein GXW82_11870 [Streptacidiphilus sp. 4-A2]|nr:hypothetical protein [Streptacidiphilus sp. 4-A2]